MKIFNIRAEQADVEKADGSTSDTQPVSVSLTVRYSIRVDKVGEVYEKYSHDGNLESFVQTATAETFKAVTARYNAPDLIGQRAKVSNDIYEVLQRKLDIYGASVISIDMRNFAFSPSYMAAINEKVGPMASTGTPSASVKWAAHSSDQSLSCSSRADAARSCRLPTKVKPSDP